jgi:hypothetical protein
MTDASTALRSGADTVLSRLIADVTGTARLRQDCGTPSRPWSPMAARSGVQRTGWGKSAVYFVAIALLRTRGSGPTVIVSLLLAPCAARVDAAARAAINARTITGGDRHLAHRRASTAAEDRRGPGDGDWHAEDVPGEQARWAAGPRPAVRGRAACWRSAPARALSWRRWPSDRGQQIPRAPDPCAASKWCSGAAQSRLRLEAPLGAAKGLSQRVTWRSRR